MEPNPDVVRESKQAFPLIAVGLGLLVFVFAVARLDFPVNQSPADVREDFHGAVPPGAESRFGRGVVNVIALSPVGGKLAVGSHVGLNLYDAETLEDDWSLASISPVVVLAWSPDEKVLAAGLENGTVVLVDSSEGQILNSLSSGEVREAHSMAWSPHRVDSLGAYYLAVGYLDGSLLLTSVDTLDVPGGTAVQGLFPHDFAGVSALAFSPIDRILASGNRAGVIHLWDATEQTWIGSMEGHDPNFAVLGLSWSPQGEKLLSSGRDGKVILWDVLTFTPAQVHDEFKGEVLALTGLGVSTEYAAMSDTGELTGWQTESGDVAYQLAGLVDHPLAATWSGDQTRLVAVDQAGQIDLWDFEAGRTSLLPTRKLVGHAPFGAWTVTVRLSPDGSLAASGLGDRIEIWDPETDTLVNELIGHESLVTSLAWSPDGSRLVSGGRDKTVRIWDPTSGREIQTLNRHNHPVVDVDWSPDGRQIASAGAQDNQVILWDVSSGEAIRTITGPDEGIWSVAWSPDGKVLGYGTAFGDVILQTLPEGPMALLRGHLNWVTSLDWSPDGTLLASAAADNRILIWDAAEARALAPLIGHGDVVSGLAFSPDGDRLASTSLDKLVMIWDTGDLDALGNLPVILEGHTDAVTDVSWSSNEDLLATGSRDGTVILWDTSMP